MPLDYIKSGNTYSSIAKSDVKDKIEVEIGDSKQTDFYPQVKVMRWDNEVNFSVRLIEDNDEKKEKETIVEEGEKIKYKKSKREAHFYNIEPNEQYPEGASEFEVILLEKPAINKVEFTIEDKDVDYFYQPPLTQEEIDAKEERPENVIGSYAVYAKTPKTNYKGGKEYKTGKVGHIYRPRIEDANGDWVWGELNIDKRILTVTIPQEFLDNAVYPVRHAAGLTFGYTSLGASVIQWSDSGGQYPSDRYRRMGSVFQSPDNLDVDSISVACSDQFSGGNGNGTAKLIINANDSSGANSHGLVTNGLIEGTIYPSQDTTGAWSTVTFSTKPSLTTGTYYVLNGVVDATSIEPYTYIHMHYDSGGESCYDALSSSTTEYSVPDNPWPPATNSQNMALSIYATYTAGSAPIFIPRMIIF